MVPMLGLNKNALSAVGSILYGDIKGDYDRYLAKITDSSDKTYFKAHIAFSKNNFGNSPTTDFWQLGTDSFSDQVDVTVTWPSMSGPEHPEQHFWLTDGVDRAKAVMEGLRDYWVDQIDNDPTTAVPAPIRMFVDSEKYLWFEWNTDKNSTALFKAYDFDPRANDSAYRIPYPGQSGSSTNKTYTQWVAEAVARYTYTSPLSDSYIPSAWPVDVLLGIGALKNEQARIWGERMWTMVFDAALNRAGYQVIKDVNDGWPECKVSAYAMSNLPRGTGLSQVWSWDQTVAGLDTYFDDTDFDVNATPFTYQWTFDNQINLNTANIYTTGYEEIGGRPTNVGLMGVISGGDLGASRDHTVAGRGAMDGLGGFRSGDYDSPVLYGIKEATSEMNFPYPRPDMRKPNLYLPPWTTPQSPSGTYKVYEVDSFSTTDNACPRDDHYLAELSPPQTPTCAAPEETYEQAFVRNSRYTVESIINGPTGDPANLVPWIALPGTTFGVNVGAATKDNLRPLLQMLRGKQVSQYLVFGDKHGQVCVGTPPYNGT